MRITLWRATLLLALVLSLAASAALAQPLPLENHYKVYQASGPGILRTVVLTDQFGTVTANVQRLERFSTPAEKILPDGTLYPMINPDVHMDWWRITAPHTTNTIIVTDQFGQNQWVVGDAHYLLLPSLKNVDPKSGAVPPTWNHYLCYDVLKGPLLGNPVMLVDQFGNVQVVVRQARFFCNPVVKEDAGRIYPIIDSSAHLACYDLDQQYPGAHIISSLDQFGFWQLSIDRSDCMCTPALKDLPVPTRQSTWGQIKGLYR